MSEKKERTPESIVLESLCEYLSYRGFFFWRNNNAPIFDGGKMVFRRMPAFARKGISDIILLTKGRAIFIEAKSPKGVQSPDQKQFQADVEKAGCEYLLARSIDDLKKYGL